MRLIHRLVMAWRLVRICNYTWRYAWVKTGFLTRPL